MQTRKVTGEVEEKTTLGMRNDIPVVQTRTVTINSEENGVTRRELHVIETCQPLSPSRNERRTFGLADTMRKSTDRRDTMTPEYPNAFNLPPHGVLTNREI